MRVTTHHLLEVLHAIDGMEDVALNPGLLQDIDAFRQAGFPGNSDILFSVPGVRTFASEELPDCNPAHWPAISVTGGACELQCDHCKANILKPMLAARSPEALWRIANESIAAGAQGFLLTGGSDRDNRVDYAPFYDILRKIKDQYPGVSIAAHTALVDRDRAHALEQAGIDVAMMDVIGAQETIEQVYHLDKTVQDFEDSLVALRQTGMRVVPHIVIGLHYGKILGEWSALDIIRRIQADALVLVILNPVFASRRKTFITPDPHEVGSFFLAVRKALAQMPVFLGCARPPGLDRLMLDIYAVLAGLNGIAHPSEGIVELARQLGKKVSVSSACCSVLQRSLLDSEYRDKPAERTVHPGMLGNIPVTVTSS